MNTATDPWAVRLERELAGPASSRAVPFTVPVRAEEALEGEARVSDDWVTLTLALPPEGWRLEGATPAPLELVSRQNILPGNVRFSLEASGALGLRADVLAASFSRDGASLRRAAEGLEHGARRLLGAEEPSEEPSAELPASEPNAAASDTEDAVDIERLFAESGWPITVRDGRATARLQDASGKPHEVTLAPLGDGTLRGHVDIVAIDAASPTSLRALGLFLLRLAASLRFLRPLLASREGRRSLGFEVAMERTADETGAALEALSLGLQLSADELRVLTDESIAGAYLAVEEARSGASRPLLFQED